MRRVVVAVLAAAIACGGPAKPVVPEAERRVIQTYAEKIKELSVEGGRLLQEDVKPRITDLRDGTVTVQQFQREAENWIRIYEDLARRFEAVSRVKRLDPVADLYDEALRTYVEAFRAFLAASRLGTQRARNDAITEAVPIAEKADQIFDRARDALSDVMRTAGLEPISL